MPLQALAWDNGKPIYDDLSSKVNLSWQLHSRFKVDFNTVIDLEEAFKGVYKYHPLKVSFDIDLCEDDPDGEGRRRVVQGGSR